MTPSYPFQSEEPSALGRQLVIDLYGCPADLLDDQETVAAVLIRAAELMGATVVETVFHRFSPYGVSGVTVIQESHLAVHTWPEHGYAAIDIFTCGDMDFEAGCAAICAGLQASSHERYFIARGHPARMGNRFKLV